MQVIRSIPQKNVFFQAEQVKPGNVTEEQEFDVVNLFDDVAYQEIIGFGGAFTESAAYNYARMSEKCRRAFLEKYFDTEKGIGYVLGRTHINSCDFSLDIYCNVADGDETLETFSVERDKKYIIPFLRDVQAYSGKDLFLIASPWSPPAYMKDNGSAVGGGRLLPQYRRLWARYFAAYVKAYAKEGVRIAGVTVQNEAKATQTWESCFYSPEDEAAFLKEALIPVFAEEGLSDVKILIWDHNKERVYDRARTVLADREINEHVWAVAHHWYSGDHFEGLSLVHEQLGKRLLATEMCLGRNDDPLTVAERYAMEFIGDLNHFTCGFIDWNILLSEAGGPYHNRSAASVSSVGHVYESKDGGLLAPILYDRSADELIVTPVWYYIGHFSKYIQPGAHRVAVTTYSQALHVTAAKNPDGSVVLVAVNETDAEKPFLLRRNGVVTDLGLPARSAMTVIMDA